MKTNSKRALTAVGFALAFSMIALPLSAGQGRFNLPFEAHWGSAVLPPGEYRLSGPSSTSSMTGVIYIYGEGKTQMVLPFTANPQADSNHSFLRLVNVGGTYVVREFSSGAAGRSYLFAIPKTLRLHMTPAQEHQVATLIEVSGQ